MNICHMEVTKIKELIEDIKESDPWIPLQLRSIHCLSYLQSRKNKREIQVRVSKLLKNIQEIKRLIEARYNIQVISTKLGRISLQEYGLKENK